MAHFLAANCAGYQTYAHPLAGGKRKRTSISDDSESAERDATSSLVRPKKSRDNKDEYNPKYMAEMCLGAYKARLHEAGFQKYTVDVANEWREDLVEMFTHAALKGFIKQDAVARHMVPRLVLLQPRNNQDKTELVKDFAKHYENVRRDLMIIDKVMLSGDEDSIAEVRECLCGLHNTLSKGARWRGLLPYTPLPLPLHRLRALRNLIEYSRPYQFLRHLVAEIDDIEDWLSFPPASLNISIFPTKLVNAVKETLQQATEDKILKTSIGPNAQDMAEYRERKTEQQRLEKEEQARQQERACVEKLQKIEAEQVQMKKYIKSLELSAANERAQEIEKKRLEAAAIATCEKSHQDQISHNTTEIRRLNTELDNLAGGQAQKIQPKVTSAASMPVGCGQLDASVGSSFSSVQTANSSVYQPQSSLGTSFGSSMGGSSYVQPGSFERTSSQRTLQDDGLPMEDVQEISPSPQHPTNSNEAGLSGAQMLMAGQSNTLDAHIRSGIPSQLLGSSNGNFKSACPAYKNGHCSAGKNCKMPHSACKFWLKGNCRYGGTCVRSHDPFFMTAATLSNQPRQSSRADEMIVDSDPAPQSSPFSQQNPFQRGRQDQTHVSQASNGMGLPDHQALPTGPRARPTAMSNITKGGQPIISQGPNITSSRGGNVFGQQTPPSGPRGSNALANRMTKHEGSMSTQSATLTFGDRETVPGHQNPSVNIRERDAFFGRITKNDYPISSRGSTIGSIKDGNTAHQQRILPGATQGPRDAIASKKVACMHNLKGKCNKGVNCQYAHEPCSHFMKGTCFAGDRCRRSHDPAFLPRSSFSNSGHQFPQSSTQQQPPQTRLEQSLDDIIQMKRGGRKENHGRLSQLQPPIQNQAPQKRLEQSLDDIIQTAGRGRKENQGRLPQSETPCRWQKTEGGCTNVSCPYKHDPQKTSNPKASRGTFGIPNLFSSIGSILRGNRQ